MKAQVGAFFIQEKALVGALSVIVKTDCETDGALHSTYQDQDQPSADHMEQYSIIIQLWHSGTSKKYGVYIIRIKYDGILSALGYTVVLSTDWKLTI